MTYLIYILVFARLMLSSVDSMSCESDMVPISQQIIEIKNSPDLELESALLFTNADTSSLRIVKPVKPIFIHPLIENSIETFDYRPP